MERPATADRMFDDPIGYLVAPTRLREVGDTEEGRRSPAAAQKPHDFWRQHWERAPGVFRGADGIRRELHGVMSWPRFLDVLEKREGRGECLHMPLDAQASSYVDETKTVLGLDDDGTAVLERGVAEELWDQAGATIQASCNAPALAQVHQPQRFDDSVWRLCASLERSLGTLFGCNAYLTPAGTQGLAPHHDDVEVFIVQTHGSKLWRVYAPLAGHELPFSSSIDLAREAIGEPVLTATLHTGDVLYLPRGFVHEATAIETASSHVTLSTYQRHSWLHFAQNFLSVSAQQDGKVACVPLSLRRGLPPAFAATQATLSASSGAAGHAVPAAEYSIGTQLAAALRDAAQMVESAPSLIQRTADDLVREFMAERLPPAPKDVRASGAPPTLDTCVCCRSEGAFQLVPPDEDELTEHCRHDIASTDPEDQTDQACLLSCLHNSREEHMMGAASGEDDEHTRSRNIGGDEEDAVPHCLDACDYGRARSLLLPARFTPAVLAVLSCIKGQSVLVKDLPGLTSSAERVHLARSLHTFGALASMEQGKGRGNKGKVKRAVSNKRKKPT